MCEWINIKNRQPFHSGDYLVAYYIGDTRYYTYAWYRAGTNEFITVKNITHWAFIPLPPMDYAE